MNNHHSPLMNDFIGPIRMIIIIIKNFFSEILLVSISSGFGEDINLWYKTNSFIHLLHQSTLVLENHVRNDIFFFLIKFTKKKSSKKYDQNQESRFWFFRTLKKKNSIESKFLS
ncbi:thioredoxin reductase 3-like [Sarcoptes scabiei]|nr:thioredoxin reductase 3-like [Sarcoptes scabiei]